MKISWVPINAKVDRGYGRVWNCLGKAMLDLGVEMAEHTDTDVDLRVVLGYPKAWFLPAGGEVCEDLVLHTMWETDTPPAAWLPVMNRARAIWSPSEWTAESFLRAGLARPLFVSPYGVDGEAFPYRERKNDRPFTFMAMGRGLGDRKGSLEVIKAFRRMDVKGARLVVKLGEIPWQNIVDAPNIEIVNLNISDRELAYRYGTADCFVYPHRGEGFGLEPLEAMSTGCCTILTRYSGPEEYIRDDACLALEPDGLESATGEAYEGHGQWAQVSEDDLYMAMTTAYRNRGWCWEVGRRAAEYVRDYWTWERAGARAVEVLETILGGVN